MQPDKIFSQAYQWTNERMGLDEIIDFLRKKTVPGGRVSLFYYFGGISLLLFIIQVVTGALLLMYYRPGANSSYESLQLIVSKVPFGWLIRNIHSWGANLMIFSVVIHMFCVFFMKSYQRPRELTWVSGAAMLFIALGFGFSGYLLPWNELSFFATQVGTDIPRTIPLLGEYLVQFLRGGPDVSGATLSRFFGVHVAVLPGIFMLVLALHLYLLQYQGISQPLSWENLSEDRKNLLPFYPNFMLRETMVWTVVLGVICALAVLLPWELGIKADPFVSAPAGIKPEWYFLFAFQALKFLPAHIGPLEGELFGIAVFSLGAALFLTLPFWDRSGGRGPLARAITWLGLIVIVYISVMTWLGYVLS